MQILTKSDLDEDTEDTYTVTVTDYGRRAETNDEITVTIMVCSPV